MSCCGGEQKPPEPPPPPGTRMVKCAKLQRELPAMKWKPWNNELGQKIYDQVSEQAWKMWTETAKMILNEYRLNLASPEATKFLFEQADKFFFGPGAALPPEYMPQMGKK